MERRDFLQQLALFGVALSSFRCKPEGGAPPLELRPAPRLPRGQPLGSAQRAALAAACERILPSAEGTPGAAEAGVIDFAAAELQRPELGEIRRRVLGGLLALDRRAARTHGGKAFVELAASEQDALIADTQRSSAQGEQFVRILISITLEGFLGDPSYGGNRGGIGWKVTGAAPFSERGRLAARVTE